MCRTLLPSEALLVKAPKISTKPPMTRSQPTTTVVTSVASTTFQSAMSPTITSAMPNATYHPHPLV